jgi:hypothetical protein
MSTINLYRITDRTRWINGATGDKTPHAGRTGHYVRAQSEAHATSIFLDRYPKADIEMTLETANVGALTFPV